MNKKSVYDYFIGLVALMLSLIIVIDIFVSIPKEVRLSFYYIENIINFVLKYRIIQRICGVFLVNILGRKIKRQVLGFKNINI